MVTPDWEDAKLCLGNFYLGDGCVSKRANTLPEVAPLQRVDSSGVQVKMGVWQATVTHRS
jgi:hypothetical protein